ncbi:hypothetical protein MNV_1440005 [Candidatus Methanoperedens nitroreducens]|uniref:Uncharacterized protein n=1 Tax=Candidatus Methanoperedens nitratireducens TaxID=1392998 RepID=A0A284VKX6_9EURY|nr:hypothetical protein MNV_1440005 [Candidatus Methanoperedens nitroreducens]
MPNFKSLRIDFNGGAQTSRPKTNMDEKTIDAAILEVRHEFIILPAFSLFLGRWNTKAVWKPRALIIESRSMLDNNAEIVPTSCGE